MSFTDITTDADYLRAVGMGPDDVPELWDVDDVDIGPYGINHVYNFYDGPPLSLEDTDPARKWDNLANVLHVLGPEMDRRGWFLNSRTGLDYYTTVSIHEIVGDQFNQIDSRSISDLPHLALLEAFYNAHQAQTKGE